MYDGSKRMKRKTHSLDLRKCGKVFLLPMHILRERETMAAIAFIPVSPLPTSDSVHWQLHAMVTSIVRRSWQRHDLNQLNPIDDSSAIGIVEARACQGHDLGSSSDFTVGYERLVYHIHSNRHWNLL